MERPEQVIFIEVDEIGLFIAQNVLSSFESSYSLNYFRDAENALNYIRDLKSSDTDRVNVFVCTEALMDDKNCINLIKEALISYSSRFFLLTTSFEILKQEKGFINEFDFSCFVDKPINESKFLACMDNSFEVA